MKKKTILTLSIICFALLLAVSAFIFTNSGDEGSLRDKYPYTGYSTLSEEQLSSLSSSVDIAQIPTDISLDELLMANNESVIVRGYFLQSKGEAKETEKTLLPEKGTSEHDMLSDTAKSFDSSIDKITPKVKSYSISFFVEDVIAGKCEPGEATIQIGKLGFELYPYVSEKDEAILLLTKADGYYNYSYQFFYVTKDGTVLSAEKYPSQDKYSGMNADEFAKELAILYEKYN